MYGIDLPQTEDYVPFQREITSRQEDKQKEGMLMTSNASVGKGGFISRTANTKAFKPVSLNDVLVSHVDDMSHFKA